MKKDLIDMNGGKAVVLDLPLLAIIGAEGATSLELTTDGNRLILSPSKASHVAGDGPGSPPRADQETRKLGANGFDPGNPRESVRLIETLQTKFGFTQEHFRRLHHAGPKASLPNHVSYCTGTGRFRTQTNAIVARRLQVCLEVREAGGSWDDAIARARGELPFPPGHGVT